MEQEIVRIDVLYGSLPVRLDTGLWIVGFEEEPRRGLWSRMANSILTLAQITRDAVRLFRDSNRFLTEYNEQFAVEGAQIGSSLRIILPADYEATKARAAEAHKRSLELLESWLTPAQLESFKAREYFEVTGSATGARYRLRAKSAFGIEVLEGEQRGCSLCVVPHGAPAMGDILLAQKIGLETNERATLAQANVSRIGVIEQIYFAELAEERAT